MIYAECPVGANGSGIKRTSLTVCTSIMGDGMEGSRRIFLGNRCARFDLNKFRGIMEENLLMVIHVIERVAAENELMKIKATSWKNPLPLFNDVYSRIRFRAILIC